MAPCWSQVGPRDGCGAAVGGPLKFARCVGFLDAAATVRAARKVAASRQPSPSPRKALSPDAAGAFIFVGRAPLAGAPPDEAVGSDDDDDDDGEGAILSSKDRDAASLRLEIVQHVAGVFPAVAAAHYGLLAAGPMVAPCCMPLPVLFSVPSIHPDTWLANKRARAFHRATVVCVYIQGFFALTKFFRGDLIGGLYDAVMAGIGVYATEAEGVRLIPSYVMMCGFNGVLGCLQVIQQMHGVPLHWLPFTVVLPPLVAMLGAYCGWQFAVELNAIGTGYEGSGRAQDSCFVRIMGGDWWPAAAPTTRSAEQEEAHSGTPSRLFNPFGGDGHRLGSQ